MENPEHQAKTVGFGTLFPGAEGPLKTFFNRGMALCITMFHLGLMLMMGGKFLKNKIQESN